MHPVMQFLWDHTCKRTVEKSQTNASSVTLYHLLRQAIWGHIWKSTAKKSQTNATNVKILALIQVHWTRRRQIYQKKCNQWDLTSSQAGYLRRHLKIHNGEKPMRRKQWNYNAGPTPRKCRCHWRGLPSGHRPRRSLAPGCAQMRLPPASWASASVLAQ